MSPVSEEGVGRSLRNPQRCCLDDQHGCQWRADVAGADHGVPHLH